MANLVDIVETEVRKYAGSGRGAKLRLFPLLDDEHQTYAVNAVDDPRTGDPAAVIILARIIGDTVIIEEDVTDKQLVEALIQRGIPREQIILAYNGEQLK